MIVDLALDALAAYRLTRLVSADVITRPLRVRLYKQQYSGTGVAGGNWWSVWNPATGKIEHDDPLPSWVEEMDRWPKTEAEWEQLAQTDEDAPKLVELVHCRWCVGVYVGFGVLAARAIAPRQWAPIAKGLALAASAALIAGLEQD